MSVFGDGAGARDARVISSSSQKSPPSGSRAPPSVLHGRRLSYQQSLSPTVYRRDSNITVQTESTDSSPTTTISTVDSTITEPSPSSSPESPNSLLPISPLTSSELSSPHSGDDSMYRPSLPTSASPSRPGFNRSDSPNKKPRNTKNLSVNTLGANRPSTSSSLPRLGSSDTASTLQDKNHASSAPVSPSFVIPYVAPKRKPSNLGLQIATPDSTAKFPLIRSGSDIVPQTPSFARLTSLRHLEGGAGLPLFSPIGAPEGGMRLPPFGGVPNSSGTPKTRPALSLSHHASFDSARSSPIVLQTLDHVPEETDHDLPLSREVKSPAYPEGPVCIYPPSVFLYLEPDDKEASNFDVVINVAREVLNPFLTAMERVSEPKTKDIGVQVDLIPNVGNPTMANSIVEPPSAKSEKSFQSAFEVLPAYSTDNPETPKPVKAGPEYIHVPWEHNTKVSLELFELCELIDNRVKQGKRVLVHCQCGVSRSASLIIAYGLYKNPDLSDTDAYNAVKERSRWINPNMHFIFEIHAFRQILADKLPKAQPKRRPGLNLLRTQTDSVLLASTYPISAMSPVEEPASAPLQNESDTTEQRFGISTPSNIVQSPEDTYCDNMAIDPVTAVPDVLLPAAGNNAVQDLDHPEIPMLLIPEPRNSIASMMMNLDTADSHSPAAVVNQARDLESLPEPNLTLPSRASPENDERSRSMSPQLRSQPSLPAGFSSLVSRRKAHRDLPLRTLFPPHLLAAQAQQVNLDSVMVDAVPDTPSLLSPRAAEFTATPFHRTAAGDLAGSSFFEQALLSARAAEADPRSPAHKGEAPITRSIDDVL
ncbi:hypothetical protein MMC13_003586 [Lambiella insularis]|nr:hypothetical protein [Lambiella insularis]